jgi:glycerol-3-phosphate dehydrogenase
MIAGGKLATYRVMAKDAVDVAVPRARECITDRIPLVGGRAVPGRRGPGVSAPDIV